MRHKFSKKINQSADEINFWKLLGLTPQSSESSIDGAYKIRRDSRKYDPKTLRSAWKVIRDPFYRLAYSNYLSYTPIKEAGFFDDGAEPESYSQERRSQYWLTTPIHKIKNSIAKLHEKSGGLKRFAVLLSTGGFSPIHKGHIAMMELAKKEIEKRGIAVLGGYISPSHDGYVSTKYNGSAALIASRRLELCEFAVSKSDWLMVDGWEARYNERPLNFTDIILKLENYLSVHLTPIKPEIFYVFGSDNAAFARAFIGKGNAVCVKRPGYGKNLKVIKKDLALNKNKNIIICENSSYALNISSSAVREKHGSNWHEKTQNNNLSSKGLIYAIRNDNTWALQPWFQLSTKKLLNYAAAIFLKKLVDNLKNIFSNTASSNKKNEVKLEIIELEKQKPVIASLSRKSPIINMDICTHGKYKLNISRLFGLSDGQCHSNNLVERPGKLKIKNQFKKIPDGNYMLVDDDIASGQTIKMVKKILPPNIKIDNAISLLKHSLPSSGSDKDILDVVDLRDFIVGSKDGGLVVRLPNETMARAPYMLPYVSLVTRAKVPPTEEASLSLKLWQLNINFFKANSKILLKNTDKAFQNLMKYIGFDNNDSMRKICEWHFNQLIKTITPEELTKKR